jgi:hypothetical protein
MGPVVRQDDLQVVVDQINGRFDYFTNAVAKLENRIQELEKVANVAPKKEKEKSNG